MREIATVWTLAQPSAATRNWWIQVRMRLVQPVVAVTDPNKTDRRVPLLPAVPVTIQATRAR
ncbi:hypothetical protein JG688_00015645 [Phytophthora aleatoria]|uniref:Uncharacterized protein n=1 Tax=Phytophthora aleatoria TaxID=2496075 RepID=A0A8J5MCU9_9STRA|nr:hypothetical protein JG688_00015645 [Phytophthora aleatoria]